MKHLPLPATFLLAGTMLPALIPLQTEAATVSPGTDIMTFDNIDLPKVSLPYTEGDYRLDLIPAVNDPDHKSHIHGHQSPPPNDSNRFIKIGYHFRGGEINRIDGQAFSLQSWEVLSSTIKTFDGANISPGTLEIAGFRNGAEVAHAQLADGQTGIMNFGPAFADIDQVEFWFGEWCKGCYLENVNSNKFFTYADPGFNNPNVQLDNLTFGAPKAVPLPAAAWLFGSALLGGGIMRRKPGTTVNS